MIARQRNTLTHAQTQRMPSRPTRATTRPPNGKPGRPSALTETTTKLFTQALLSLNTIDDAFVIAGIHPSTGHRWIAKGKKASAGEYRDFYEAVEEARAKAKALLVGKVVVAGRSDANMALKILERRYPKEWARTQKLEVDDKTPPGKREGMRDRLMASLDQIEKRLTAPTPAISPTSDDND